MSDLVKEEARDGNFDEAMDALEDCCSVGNPNNPRDNGSMESAKEELRDAINNSDLTNDQKQAASDQIDNMPKGPTASESQQSAEQARNDANEANSQASQNNPQQAQSALDNAVDNLNDAIDNAETREDWGAIKDAAEAGRQAAEVMGDQESADNFDDVAQEASQNINEQKWGILDKDTGEFVQDAGKPLQFDSEQEAKAIADNMEGNYEASPLGNPIDEAMTQADMGDLDQDRADIKDAFEEAYEEELQRLGKLRDYLHYC